MAALYTNMCSCTSQNQCNLKTERILDYKLLGYKKCLQVNKQPWQEAGCCNNPVTNKTLVREREREQLYSSSGGCACLDSGETLFGLPLCSSDEKFAE